MDLKEVLRLLGDGEFHSGEHLGEALQVSRTAVWKHLQKLEDVGLVVESVRGKGYRLPGGIELLERELILSQLDEAARDLLARLELLDRVDSTNTFFLHGAGVSLPPGSVCLAECQTAGRGRLGRRWVSPLGKNIYLSVSLEFEGGISAVEGLSLAVGVALANALEDLGCHGIGLKWPNDLLHERRKLAGILLEISGDPEGAIRVVAGMGVNVVGAGRVTGGIDQPYTCVQDVAGADVSRNQVAAALLNRLLPEMARFQKFGFAPLRARWNELNAHRNVEVALTTPASSIKGVNRGVSEAGALRLELSDGIREFSGGEISMREV